MGIVFLSIAFLISGAVMAVTATICLAVIFYFDKRGEIGKDTSRFLHWFKIYTISHQLMQLAFVFVAISTIIATISMLIL